MNILYRILIWLFVTHAKVTTLTVIILFLILAITAIIDGYLDYREKDNAPKEEMFMCPKGHGFFPRRLCLPLFPHLTTGDNKRPSNAYICPTCYKETVFDKPDERLKNGSNMRSAS